MQNMTTANSVAPEPPVLLARYERLRSEEKNMRIRDAAHRLGVSEAELVAARCGQGVTRLDDRWAEMIQAMPGLAMS